MRNLLAMVVVLLWGEAVLAKGLSVIRARVASRLLQVQRVAAVNHLLLAARKDDNLRMLLVVLASNEDMPDGTVRKNDSDSPDDPKGGRPAWAEERRRGSASSYIDERGSDSAVHWDRAEKSAVHWDR